MNVRGKVIDVRRKTVAIGIVCGVLYECFYEDRGIVQQ